MEVTIIVPIHNSEKYLKECIKSALDQTFYDIEILCIDGGSTDLSFEIIKELREEDSRIQYIRDSNTSYGHKINLGINIARGKYIAILESDDRMCSEFIKRSYDIARASGADIVDVDFYELFNYKGKEFNCSVRKYYPNTYGHLIKKFDSFNRDSVIRGIWTALFRKEFLLKNKIQLNESKGASYQDFSFLFLVSLLSESTYHLMVPLYQYRKDNVASSVKDDHKIFEIAEECDFLKCDLEKRKVCDRNIWRLYYMKKYEAYYWNYFRLSSQARKVFMEKYMEELMDDVEQGNLRREMVNADEYQTTFLLLDDKNEFINRVTERDQYLSLTKLCYILDESKDRDLVIFGAGSWGSKIVDVLQQNNAKVLGICDNSKELQNTVKYGFEISPVEIAVKKFSNASFLIANRKNSDIMRRQLLENGIKAENILVFI